MQRVDRGVEIAMLLLQPGELDMELALVLVGHGFRWLKRAIGSVETVERISSLCSEFATKLAAFEALFRFRNGPPPRVSSRHRREIISFG